MLIKQFPEFFHPFIVIFSAFTHQDRHIKPGPEVDVFLYFLLHRGHPVLMKGIDQLIIKRLGKDREIGFPYCTPDKNDMVSINLPDSFSDPLVERFQIGLQAVLFKIVWDGFVQQVITDNGSISGISHCNFPPEVTGLLLHSRIHHQPWITVAVVDVVAGLPTGGTVHIKQNINVELRTPGDGFVKVFITVYIPSQEVIVGQQAVIERQTDDVYTGFRQPPDVGFCDVMLQEGIPESCCGTVADQFQDGLVDFAWGITIPQFKHIPFRKEPVPQVHTLQVQQRSLR